MLQAILDHAQIDEGGGILTAPRVDHETVGPIEVRLTLRPGGFGVNLVMIRDDGSTIRTADYDPGVLTLRSEERGMTEYLDGAGYNAVGRWEITKRGAHGKALQVRRRFAPKDEKAQAF